MDKWIEGVTTPGEKGVITFPKGVLSFPHAKRFMILESNTEEPIFRWLQSLDDPSVAFVVADPELFVQDYWETIAIEDLRDCVLKPQEMPVFLVIVTVPADDPYEMSANLLAPLVLSPSTGVARQVVLSYSTYSSRYPVFEMVKTALVGAEG